MQWRVELADPRQEVVVDIVSDVDPDEDEFGEVIAQAVGRLGHNPDNVEDWWPND